MESSSRLLVGLSYFLYSVHAVWQSPQSADASAVTVLIDPGHGGVDGGAKVHSVQLRGDRGELAPDGGEQRVDDLVKRFA